MLRKHDKEDRFRRERKVGWCDPRIANHEDGSWHLYYLEWPPVDDHMWFICSPRGRPFPHSSAYTPGQAVTAFLNPLNLPEGRDKYGRVHRHTDEPERGRWWRWFKNQGYSIQQFKVNPKDDSANSKSIMDFLEYELEWANMRSDGCIWCRGTKRFQNISQRLATMIDAIDYYSERPEEQQRWLQTMSHLRHAKKTGERI
jgi:hypothetical protein